MDNVVFQSSALGVCAFAAAHVTWRAGAMLRNLHPWDKPSLFTQLGIAGSAFMAGMVPLAFAAATATFIWTFVHLPWWLPVPLFFISGMAFGLVHNALTRVSPAQYIGYFPAVGALVGALGVLITQGVLWW
ncbi:hypothetical protein H8N03_25835 [Ramlibacter sp. USB13]|uniref:Uncharacterized protein n=1 Tax=Ramlibacter cellulosilyticus TaxID=2764187 RepID=A0A923SDU2_9BURK|nr:hypothetical protein [Ramlibacter cellulosilyticus]MBC5786385.1 hypothetical protein [Ramlibacter cellulosilyticus]